MRGQNPLTDFINAVVRRFRLTDGTIVEFDAVADNEYVRRSGNTLVGGTPVGSERVLVFEFDGGGQELETSINHAVLISCPFDCTITEIYIKDVTDTAGSCTIDIWKDNRSNDTPTLSDSITGSGTKPFISGSAIESVPQTTFTSWTTTDFDAEDEIHAVLTTVTGHKHLVMFVKVVGI